LLFGDSRVISNDVTTDPFRGLDFQVQQTTRIGRHQLIVGQQYVTQKKENRCEEQVSFLGEPVFPFHNQVYGSDDASVTYVRGEVRVHPRLHLTAGAGYTQMEYADFVLGQREESKEWSPVVGVSFRLTPATVMRAAGFRNLNSDVFGSRIAPPAVAGFASERNELPAAVRDEFNLSFEMSRSRAFVAVRAVARDTRVPYLLQAGRFFPDADARAVGASAYLNLILTPRVSLFADDQFLHFGADAFDRNDNLLRAGVNVIHERGLFARLTVSQVTQRFRDTAVTDLPRSSFALADLEIGYEFAAKRGRVNLRMTNAFDRTFGLVLEGLSVDPVLPRRQALLSLRWRMF
jgi:hypothetical protein